MALTITNQAPRFHSLTGKQDEGRTQVATSTDYAGAVTLLYRAAKQYWVVTTRSVVRAFSDGSEAGAVAAIWFDAHEGRLVIDYTDKFGDRVEAYRTESLGAAIGVATDVTTQRWARQQAAL